MQGTIRVSANDLPIGTYVFAPVKADVFLDRNSVRIQVLDARLCGIAVSGHIQPLGQDMLIDLQPVAVGQPLEPLLDCLSSNKRITGTFSLIGKFHGKGKTRSDHPLPRRVDRVLGQGRQVLHLSAPGAHPGIPERDGAAAGKLPDMGRDGFAYQSIKVKGEMKGGKLMLREASWRAPR